MGSAAAVRRAAVAGSWYPGTAAAIAREVEGYLAAARLPALRGRLVGLVAPHAGLRYSGPVAAYSYGLLRGRSGLTAVLAGPSHRATFRGCAVYARGAWETPLGMLPIDEELAAGLLDAAAGVHDAPAPHRDEHSLEMQLPFLQHLVPGLRIVPVMLGTQTRPEVDALAERLARAVGRRTDVVLVASSDLSHYHPAPAANRLDALVVGDVERFDPEGLMTRLEDSWEHACGGGAIVAVMRACRALGADRATLLRYADSGDAGEHDKSRVVGYMAAAFSAGAA
jgi:AmmeMemoRadiSam system protein B